nr:MAG TPA: hypothetical protein [Caudoviricetes sp.]
MFDTFKLVLEITSSILSIWVLIYLFRNRKK